MNKQKNIETTFCMIKPDAVARGHIGVILSRLEASGFKLHAARLMQIPQSLCEAFYQEHRQKPFFSSLVQFITSGPVFVMALVKTQAVCDLRTLMGHTDPKKAHKNTLRALYGTSIEKNAVHGSDSLTSAKKELSLFF